MFNAARNYLKVESECSNKAEKNRRRKARKLAKKIEIENIASTSIVTIKQETSCDADSKRKREINQTPYSAITET